MKKQFARRGILGLLAGIPGVIGLNRTVRADESYPRDPDVGYWERRVEEEFSKPPIKVEPKHPIFGVQTVEPHPVTGKEQLHTLRVRYVERMSAEEMERVSREIVKQNIGTAEFEAIRKNLNEEQASAPRLSIQILKEDVSAVRYPALEHAENAIFAQVDLAPLFDEPREQQSRTVNPILINRAANRIASRTRRGAGNVVLVHEDDLPLITGTGLNSFQPGESARTIGRWTNVGTLNHCIEIWTTPDNPPGFTRARGWRSALVGYRGNEMDAGGYIAETPTGYGFVSLPNSPSSMGNMNDYFQMVYLHTGEAVA